MNKPAKNNTIGPYRGRNGVYHFLDDDELEELEFNLYKKEETKKDIGFKEAYEMNKTRNKCVLCGEDTIDKQLFTSSIKYCPCIENKKE